MAAHGSYGFIGGGLMAEDDNTYITHLGWVSLPESVKAIGIFFSTSVISLKFDVAYIDEALPHTIERLAATAFGASFSLLSSIAFDSSMIGN